MTCLTVCYTVFYSWNKIVNNNSHLKGVLALQETSLYQWQHESKLLQLKDTISQESKSLLTTKQLDLYPSLFLF